MQHANAGRNTRTLSQITELPSYQNNAEAGILKRLNRFGISGWAEVLLCLPKGYQDYSTCSTLRQAFQTSGVQSEPRLFSFVVTERPVTVTAPKRRIQFSATDGMLTVKITVFVVKGVDVGYWRSLVVGQTFYVLASLQNWAGRLQITNPLAVPEDLVGRIIPKYPSKRGVIAADAIASACRYALANHLEDTVVHIIKSFHGLLEQDILHAVGIKHPTLSAFLHNLHQPSSLPDAETALDQARRLAAFSVVYNAKQQKMRGRETSSAIPLKPVILEKLIARLPYPLTGDQRRAVDEIVADLMSPYPMRRVLSGDTGSGKTYTFMLPALAAQIAGRRVVILTPNAPLAEQFVNECRDAYGQHVPVKLVTAATGKTIDLAGNPILVGTTALLFRLKELNDIPDFVVIDEQQRFSVSQKAELVASSTNLLEATATPIPRTTALITHGGLDITILRESPVNRNVVTRIVGSNEIKRLYEHTAKIIASGSQVAVVYPVVRGKTKVHQSVGSAFERWSKKFPGKVGTAHGDMSEAEKSEAISKLRSGEHQIGIVSSIIEIGLTLPLLKSMVIVNPEVYGVSTLHQFRGRLARKGGNGYFFLHTPNEVKPEAHARLRLVEECNDGFELAERDAQMRGYGDLGEGAERQHGKSPSTLFFGVSLVPQDIVEAETAYSSAHEKTKRVANDTLPMHGLSFAGEPSILCNLLGESICRRQK